MVRRGQQPTVRRQRERQLRPRRIGFDVDDARLPGRVGAARGKGMAPGVGLEPPAQRHAQRDARILDAAAIGAIERLPRQPPPHRRRQLAAQQRDVRRRTAAQRAQLHGTERRHHELRRTPGQRRGHGRERVRRPDPTPRHQAQPHRRARVDAEAAEAAVVGDRHCFDRSHRAVAEHVDEAQRQPGQRRPGGIARLHQELLEPFAAQHRTVRALLERAAAERRPDEHPTAVDAVGAGEGAAQFAVRIAPPHAAHGEIVQAAIDRDQPAIAQFGGGLVAWRQHVQRHAGHRTAVVGAQGAQHERGRHRILGRHRRGRGQQQRQQSTAAGPTTAPSNAGRHAGQYVRSRPTSRQLSVKRDAAAARAVVPSPPPPLR